MKGTSYGYGDDPLIETRDGPWSAPSIKQRAKITGRVHFGR
jgi:hypothetical protein